MASIDYISEYYKLSKCKYSNIYRVLTIQIRNSIYNQYYELFLKYSTSRQKYHEAEQLCKLWFFIHFNCSLENSKLSIEILRYAIKCNNPNQIIYYKNYLERLHLIFISRNISSYTKDNQLHYSSDICSYQIHELESNLDFSSKVYKVIDYPILYSDVDYRSLMYKNKPSSNHTISTCPYIELSSSQLSNCGSNSFSRKWNFYIEDFYSRYNRLNYYTLIGRLDEELTSELKNSVAYLHDDGRVYHRFHSIPSDYRNTRVYMDNERLVEAFDVHNAMHCLLNCIFDNTIPQKEKDSFYALTTSGQFYENIRDWVNRVYGANWQREDAKTYINSYYNTTRYSAAVKCVDAYFSDNYPCIREFIRNYPKHLKEVTDRTYKLVNGKMELIETTKKKLVSDISKNINKVETDIMIKGICKDLYENYGIEAITVHDAVYVKESDAAFMKSNGISTEQMFYEYLEIYKYI